MVENMTQYTVTFFAGEIDSAFPVTAPVKIMS